MKKVTIFKGKEDEPVKFSDEDEFYALRDLVDILKPIPKEARNRVLDYLDARFRLSDY